MRSLSQLVCILVFPVIAAGGEVVIQGDIYPRSIAPTFDHGYLAVYERNGIAVYAPDGTPSMRFVSPERADAENADIDTDGSVAIAVNQYKPQAGRISLFSPDGAPTGQIDTGSYLPSQVCFAPDHSVWTLGDEDQVPAAPDYYLLRHYSRAGNLLGEFVRRSEFPKGSGPGQVVVGLWGLRIVNGRIGVLLTHAAPNEMSLWLEADLTGKETGRWTMASNRPAAITDSGAVYAQGKGISKLDRASGTWKTVQESSDDTLLGADGNTLVFKVRGTSRIRRSIPQ